MAGHVCNGSATFATDSAHGLVGAVATLITYPGQPNAMIGSDHSFILGDYSHFVGITTTLVFPRAPTAFYEYHGVSVKHQSVARKFLFDQAHGAGTHIRIGECTLDLLSIFAGLLGSNSDLFLIIFHHETGTQYTHPSRVETLTVLGNVIPKVEDLNPIAVFLAKADFRDVVAISVLDAHPTSVRKPFANNDTHALYLDHVLAYKHTTQVLRWHRIIVDDGHVVGGCA